MLTAAALRAMDRRELRELLRSGHPIDPRSLDDSQYRGVSLGLPWWVERFTWKKFMKVFRRDGRVLRGYNVRLEQNAIDGPCLPLRDAAGAPRCFGPYEVVEVPAERMPGGRRPGLVIDYGRAPANRHGPFRALRDPIVALRQDDVSLLLGRSLLDLGVATVGTPSYFSLEYDGPLATFPAGEPPCSEQRGPSPGP